jgi:ribonucleoside-diphosphate reductase alpha chain
MSKSIYEEYSDQRKELQASGEIPEWFTTLGWQMIKEKYVVNEDDTMKSIYTRISRRAAERIADNYFTHGKKKKIEEEWFNKFYDLMWKGWLAPSTPVMANMGADRGCPVSCSGNYVGDSVYDFYDDQKEIAVLSKNGFGTSSYLGDIRARGTNIASTGGKASGMLPVMRDFIQCSRDISQGGTRRGAWAGYIEIDHDDFWESINWVKSNPDDCNIGWIITNDFIERLNSGDKDAIDRFQSSLELKMISGKGYYFFRDKVNDLSPVYYKERGLKVLASNLCTEITLMSDKDHTFTCVLSSMNLAKYDEWKDTDAVFVATVFLDAVASEFIRVGKNKRGLEKAVRFTEKSRALGLGTLGFHTYLQMQKLPFESLEAHMLNIQIYKKFGEDAKKASSWMAEEFGEPEWCEGYGVRNTHNIAIAPNLSSAVLCGSVSQGIEPMYENVFVQGGAAGEMDRINPVLIDVMKACGVYNEQTLDDIVNNNGSVQHVPWLSEHEKLVFKTAFEIDQTVIIRLASARQKYIDQAQSINLFFDAKEDEEYISKIHEMAFKDPYIKSLYYIRSKAGVQASKDTCFACEG